MLHASITTSLLSGGAAPAPAAPGAPAVGVRSVSGPSAPCSIADLVELIEDRLHALGNVFCVLKICNDRRYHQFLVLQVVLQLPKQEALCKQ